MKNLYKGRYLIAIYDKNDECIGVFKSVRELKENNDINQPYSIFYKMLNGEYGKMFSKYYLIDCLEEHDDIFKEEDKLFLQERE